MPLGTTNHILECPCRIHADAVTNRIDYLFEPVQGVFESNHESGIVCVNKLACLSDDGFLTVAVYEVLSRVGAYLHRDTACASHSTCLQGLCSYPLLYKQFGVYYIGPACRHQDEES
jgi:hypothetical protein